jgi:L-threonylcarbamoyladenylate synthase
LTEFLVVDPEHPAPPAIARAVAVLRAGGLVALPTETVYGLAARADDARAVAAIYAAKGRPAHNPLIVHLADLATARSLARTWPAAAQALAEAFWPGPLTLVLPLGEPRLAAVTAGGETIALRVPAHPVIAAVLRESGLPLAAPSANRSQSISPTRAEHVRQSLGAAVDLVLDAGPCALGIESAVVDVRGPQVRLLRPGAIDLATLRRVWPDLAERGPDPAAGAGRGSPGLDRRHYAPRAALHLVETALLPAALAAATRPVGLLRCSPGPADGADWSETLGPGPLAYGRELYAALHRADAAGCRELLVEQPPSGRAWEAVLDRLTRAAAR